MKFDRKVTVFSSNKVHFRTDNADRTEFFNINWWKCQVVCRENCGTTKGCKQHVATCSPYMRVDYLYFRGAYDYSAQKNPLSSGCGSSGSPRFPLPKFPVGEPPPDPQRILQPSYPQFERS